MMTLLPPSSCRRHRSCCRLRGQASVELLVIALVLLPLLLILPMLGKLADLSHASAFASRYLAFEASIHHGDSADGWKSPALLEAEVSQRFFSDSSTAVRSITAANAANADAANPLWSGLHGGSLLGQPAQVEVSRSAAIAPSGAFFASALQLPADRLYRSDVQITVAPLASLPPFDTLGLEIRRHAVLSIDSWAAASPDVVRQRLRATPNQLSGPFPFRPLQTLAQGLGPVVGLLEARQPPQVGRVDPDIVPADRQR